MSGLSDFLNPILPEEEEVYVSRRFVRRDEEGNIMMDSAGNPVLRPFRIRALTQEENGKISKAATRVRMVNGVPTPDLDSEDYNRRLIVAATVDPDFTNTAMCQKVGTLDPLEVPGKMLLAGENAVLLRAITRLSGFGADAAAQIQNDAKN